jgi:hypothetical protein
MTNARALAGAALAASLGLARPAPAQTAPPALDAPADLDAPATNTPTITATPKEPARRGSWYPLLFLFQGDAVVDSQPSGTGAAAGDDPTAGSHLRLRRLRFGEDLWLGPVRLRAFVEASSRDDAFAPVEGQRLPFAGSVRLPEAFVAWRPHRAFEVEAGATRVPLSLSRQVDELDLRLPERAQAIVALAPDYRTGVAMRSDLGAMDIRIAGMSADTSLDEQLFSSGFFGAARIGADPIGPMGVAPWRRRRDDPWYCWPRFSAGVSILYGTLLAPRTLAFGADGQLQARRVTITGEYLAQHLDASPAALPTQGAVLEPGVYLISERLELVLREAWLHQPATAGAAYASTDTLATGGALTFLARDGHLRFQAGLELRHTVDHRLPDSSWGIVRLTLAL